MWARVKCREGRFTPDGEQNDEVNCTTSPFIIGRAKACDLTVTSSKCVSSRHCKIFENRVSHTAFVEDLSTNGTLLNGVKLTRYNAVPIHAGDVVGLVQKKEDPTQNLSFEFLLTGERRDEEAKPTQVQSSSIDTGGDGTAVGGAGIDRGEKRKAASAADGDDVTDGPAAKKVAKSTLPSDAAATAADNMLETLTCGICQEILHGCVSLQPCLHAFCAGCFCPWMARSKRCPQCRKKTEAVSKNHIVNNLVECFLTQHPNKKRDPADLADLDARNTIKEETVRIIRRRRYDGNDDDDDDDDGDDYDDDDGSDEYDDDDDDDDDDTDDDVHPGAQFGAFGFGNVPLPVFGGNFHGFGARPGPAFQQVCRQCPGYVGPYAIPAPTATQPATDVTAATGDACATAAKCNASATAACADNTNDAAVAVLPPPDQNAQPQAAAAASPTNSAAPAPTPHFVCGQFTPHLMCLCCQEPMPDRRNDAQQPAVPRQQCQLCNTFYCHMYWGCKRPGCTGCLGEFQSFNATENMYLSLVNRNPTESKVVEDHMKASNKGIKDLLAVCVKKLADNTYSTRDSALGRLTPETVVCHKCFLRNLQELAFQFRRDIPVRELPEGIRNRPNCHWGRECRTQSCKPHHAERFNHICERTRFD